MGAKCTLGIGVGLTASKCVIVKDRQEIVSKSLASMGASVSDPERVVKEVLDNYGMEKEDMNFILDTGYGRNSLDIVGDQMSELSCYAKDAYYLFPEAHTVTDIGEQDMKVLRVDNDAMVNSRMDDKCITGTRRFLDVATHVLKVNAAEPDDLGAGSAKRVTISSICAAFAESGVISQLAQGSEVCDTINDIHHSIATRTNGLARRAGTCNRVVMTGDITQNASVTVVLEEELGHKVYTSPLAQYAGVLNVALFACQKVTRKKQYKTIE